MAETQRSEVDWLARVLIIGGAFPLFFGWIFLVAGIGIVYITLGLLMIVAGVAIRRTWRRVGLGLVAVAIGCSPVLFLLVWIGLGMGEQR